MDNNILILGKGFIGSKLQEELGCVISDREIHSFKDVEEEIKKFNPRVIINCIGYIGRDVDECELDKDSTLVSNTFIPLILAEVAARHKIRLIHISTGCIYHFDYSKDKPIDEDKIPDYFNLFYSRSKIYSDQALKVLSSQYPILIVRPRIPLDNRPSPKNILNKLINYKNNIIDIPNSVTYMPDFAKAVKHLVKVEAMGIYHVVNKGGLRYPELLDVYKKYVPDFKYTVIDYKSLKIDRTNIILSTQKLEKTGFKVRDIHEVLEECVKEYLKY
jgi:dTDP-4-dehydrorhamnose reductase